MTYYRETISNNANNVWKAQITRPLLALKNHFKAKPSKFESPKAYKKIHENLKSAQIVQNVFFQVQKRGLRFENTSI